MFIFETAPGMERGEGRGGEGGWFGMGGGGIGARDLFPYGMWGVLSSSASSAVLPSPCRVSQLWTD